MEKGISKIVKRVFSRGLLLGLPLLLLACGTPGSTDADIIASGPNPSMPGLASYIDLKSNKFDPLSLKTIPGEDIKDDVELGIYANALGRISYDHPLADQLLFSLTVFNTIKDDGCKLFRGNVHLRSLYVQDLPQLREIIFNAPIWISSSDPLLKFVCPGNQVYTVERGHLINEEGGETLVHRVPGNYYLIRFLEITPDYIVQFNGHLKDSILIPESDTILLGPFPSFGKFNILETLEENFAFMLNKEDMAEYGRLHFRFKNTNKWNGDERPTPELPEDFFYPL